MLLSFGGFYDNGLIVCVEYPLGLSTRAARAGVPMLLSFGGFYDNGLIVCVEYPWLIHHIQLQSRPFVVDRLNLDILHNLIYHLLCIDSTRVQLFPPFFLFHRTVNTSVIGPRT